tara:strand:- start:794 stop:1852 length:1059 start_codon:yes stop_codon:yes gene_type:complete
MNSLALLFVAIVSAASPAPEKTPVTVGIHSFEPCVIEKDGEATGFDIDILSASMERAGFNYQTRSYETVSDLLDALRNGEIDAAMAGLSITSKREREFDFTQPYYKSGLRILISENGATYSFWKFKYARNVVKALINPAVVEPFLCMGMLILGFALLMWICEKGSDSINDKFFPGIFEAIYYSIVTSSTVGYGDITPKKWIGRIAAVCLIFLGIVMFANATGVLSVEYNQDMLEYSITGPKDLKGEIVSTKYGTTSMDAVEKWEALAQPVKEIGLAFELLKQGKVAAVVFDAPVVDWAAKHYSGLVIVPGLYEPQNYGIVLSEGSDMKEPLDKAILSIQEDGTWRKIHDRWF